MSIAYPDSPSERDRWILSRRPARNATDPLRPYAVLLEHERAESGQIVPVATVFLTNRECPWRCLMCDLWKNTLTETVPVGAIPVQIDRAFSELGINPAPASSESPTARQLKLYNSGSFFDPRAIPPEDHAAIAARTKRFERVIVECHPALVGEQVLRFRDQLAGNLEVAIGLETAHPETLAKLNKRMTVEQFARAAEFLRQHDIALRVFVLVKPPFLDEREALTWARRSTEFAFDCGASVVSLIPTRGGNGAMEALVEQGDFAPPELATLEAALDHGIQLKRGRVFADLWDLERFSRCPACFPARRARMERMNHSQVIETAVACPSCDSLPPAGRSVKIRNDER